MYMCRPKFYVKTAVFFVLGGKILFLCLLLRFNSLFSLFLLSIHFIAIFKLSRVRYICYSPPTTT